MSGKVDLTTSTVRLYRDGTSTVDSTDSGPPRRIDGYNVGAPLVMPGLRHHNGEMHPDADELLYLVSGSARLSLELPDGEETIELTAGDACIVPRGVWHQLEANEPSRLIHVTPGPGGDFRPLESKT